MGLLGPPILLRILRVEGIDLAHSSSHVKKITRLQELFRRFGRRCRFIRSRQKAWSQAYAQGGFRGIQKEGPTARFVEGAE